MEKNLVVYEVDEDGQGRYRLLETVRQYTRDRVPWSIGSIHEGTLCASVGITDLVIARQHEAARFGVCAS